VAFLSFCSLCASYRGQHPPFLIAPPGFLRLISHSVPISHFPGRLRSIKILSPSIRYAGSPET